MAIIEIVPFGDRQKNLHLINSWIVASSEEKIGDIKKWLDDMEALKEPVNTAFTPMAMMEYYNLPESVMSNAINMEVGGHFIYNSYKVKKITKNLCAVEEND